MILFPKMIQKPKPGWSSAACNWAINSNEIEAKQIHKILTIFLFDCPRNSMWKKNSKLHGKP